MSTITTSMRMKTQVVQKVRRLAEEENRSYSNMVETMLIAQIELLKNPRMDDEEAKSEFISNTIAQFMEFLENEKGVPMKDEYYEEFLGA